MNLPGLDDSECCRDGVEAAKEGHLDCLVRLQGQGRFLELHSQEREEAGEARKSQAWEAAVAACEAGQEHVLAWLLSAGWPARVDVDTDPWYLYHAAQPHQQDEFLNLMLDARLPCTGRRNMWGAGGWPRTELALYRHAVRSPERACLDVLLHAGCRSEWICPLAAWEGRPGRLVLAGRRGCACDAHTLYAAASRGCIGVLQGAHWMAIVQRSLSTLDDLAHSRILRKCLEAAARVGSVECVMALLRCSDRSLPNSLGSRPVIGHQNHLQQSVKSLEVGHLDEEARCAARAQLSKLNVAAWSAARAGQPACLSCVLNHVPLLDLRLVSQVAARARQLECFKLLGERGSPVDRRVVIAAVEGGCPECLRYILDRILIFPSTILYLALRRSTECEKLFPIMFEKGVFPKSPQMWTFLQHMLSRGPRSFFKIGNFKSLKLLVENCGPPPKQFLSTAAAAAEGVSALAYVRDLGAEWEEGTLCAARCVETLRYARQHGCPYDTSPVSCSLPLTSFDVLQYVCEHMDHTWAKEVLANAVKKHAQLFNCGAEGDREGSPSPIVDFRVPLYLIQRYGSTWLGDLAQLDDLAQLADVARSRAAASAQCFYRAGKFSREGWGGEVVALWDSMARCPEEICRRIACEAQLVLP